MLNNSSVASNSKHTSTISSAANINHGYVTSHNKQVIISRPRLVSRDENVDLVVSEKHLKSLEGDYKQSKVSPIKVPHTTISTVSQPNSCIAIDSVDIQGAFIKNAFNFLEEYEDTPDCSEPASHSNNGFRV